MSEIRESPVQPCRAKSRVMKGSEMGLIDAEFVETSLTKEAPFCESHGAQGSYLGIGLLYYSLVYARRTRVAVCLGSGGGFVPRLMRQAQRDLGIDADSRTILVDADLPQAGW